MGGCGSGKWYRWNSKNTTDASLSLDVNWLHRMGYLSPGGWSSVRWTCNGQAIGNISLRAEVGRLVLVYRSRSGGGDWEEVEEPVWLTWTPCNYGGQRPWFVCPEARCGRRVGKLYAGGKYFLCRHCYGLAYESQRESPWFRQLSKAQNIRRRLGGSMCTGDPFPDRPKGMHLRTYRRLLQKHNEADMGSWIAVAEWLDKHS